ncbi:MAG: serine/threonine-protein kinase [Bryobacteraceae bacterium]|jgi:tetratricopeptide (TPR) repeat protein
MNSEAFEPSAPSEPCFDPELLEELFFAASEVSEEGIPAFLNGRCAGQPELRRTLEGLLRTSKKTGVASALWDQPAIQIEARQLAQEPRLPFARLGPYRILARIGAGGMGAVFLAERDDEGLHKRVAIKMVPLSFADAEAVRRFQLERQILARLEHPNIARMLDAGRAPDGLPYLVMEYVDGMPIDRYAAAHNLTVAQRVGLFRDICSAVSYAHANLIVHRDLKPGNILVNAEGSPKLLDFGIAKLLSDTADPDATSTGVMTPGYASPEQVAGLPITTASDVYSLGVVLYELLTGRKPAPPPHDPSRPSASLRQLPVPPGAPPDALRRVRADLDQVVLTSLRREPRRRYASAAEFSEDVHRAIEGYPVKAHPDNWSYRLARFVSRRRVEVGVAAAALLAMLAAGGFALSQYRAANRRFNDTWHLVDSVLFEFNDAIADLPGSTAARLLVAKRAQQYLDLLARDRSSDPTLRRDLALAHRKLGDILGRPFYPNLGDTAGALDNYRKAAGLLERLSAGGHRDSALVIELALVYGRLGKISVRERKLDEAIQLNEKAVALLEPAVARNPSPDLHMELASACINLSLAWNTAGAQRQSPEPYRSAIASGERALDIVMPMVEAAPRNEQYRFTAARIFQALAYADDGAALYIPDTGYFVRALAWHQKAHAQIEAAYGLNPGRYRRVLAESWGDLSGAYLKAGDARRAEAAGREQLRREQRIAGVDPQNAEARRDLAGSLRLVSQALIAQRRGREGFALGERALEMFEALLRQHPGTQEDLEQIVYLHDSMAQYLLAAGKRTAAAEHYRRNIEHLESAPAFMGGTSLALEYGLLAGALAPVDRAQATKYYAQAISLWERLRNAGQLPPIYADQPASLRKAAATVAAR